MLTNLRHMQNFLLQKLNIYGMYIYVLKKNEALKPSNT